MTGLGAQAGSPGKKGSKIQGRDQPKPTSKTSFRTLEQSKNLDKENYVVEENKELNMSLSDDYEDDDFTIYFDKPSLLNHLNHLEDDNLFKINLL